MPRCTTRQYGPWCKFWQPTISTQSYHWPKETTAHNEKPSLDTDQMPRQRLQENSGPLKNARHKGAICDSLLAAGPSCFPSCLKAPDFATCCSLRIRCGSLIQGLPQKETAVPVSVCGLSALQADYYGEHRCLPGPPKCPREWTLYC